MSSAPLDNAVAEGFTLLKYVQIIVIVIVVVVVVMLIVIVIVIVIVVGIGIGIVVVIVIVFVFVIVVLINQTMFLKFLLLNQNIIRMKHHPSSAVQWEIK